VSITRNPEMLQVVYFHEMQIMVAVTYHTRFTSGPLFNVYGPLCLRLLSACLIDFAYRDLYCNSTSVCYCIVKKPPEICIIYMYK
jgi:hypothetical protein